MNQVKNLFVGLLVTVLFLLLLEAIAHGVEFVKPPPVTWVELPPKPEGTYRIIVYGGSTSAGLPIKRFGFAAQLEFWLRELHPEKPFEVYNLGRAGWPSESTRRMVEETITYDPDLLIVLSAHNEFLNRRIQKPTSEDLLASFALTRVLTRLWNKVQPDPIPEPEQEVRPQHIEGYDRAAPLFEQKIRRHRDNLHRIKEIARKHNKPLMLLTAPSNVEDWPPVYRRITTQDQEQEYEAWMAEVDTLLAHGRSDAATARIDELLQTHPDHPLLLYLLAKAHTAAGHYEHAGMLFTQAKDLDPLPWRAPSTINQTIRALAEPTDRVFLVDVEERFREQAPHGLVGFSLVVDNCHPTPLGNAIITREILSVMRQNRLFIERDPAPLPIDHALEHFTAQTTTPEKRRSLATTYLLLSAKYSMSPPFYQYKASRMYLDEAMRLDSSRWEVWVNLVTLALFEGRIEEGKEQLSTAIQLREVPIDLENRKDAPHLKEALLQAGIRLEEASNL